MKVMLNRIFKRCLVSFFAILMVFGQIRSASAEVYCSPTHTEPAVARLTIKVFFVENAGKIYPSVPNPIPVGSRVHFDATAKAATGNCLTDGSKKITWTVTPAGHDIKMGDFTPTLSADKDGAYTISATLDGIQSNPLTLNIGTGGAAGGGQQDTKYCAYTKDSVVTCIFTSADDTSCEAAECHNTGVACTRVALDACKNTGSKFCAAQPLVNPPAQDLGALIGKLFTWSIGMLGLAVFLMMFYHGFMWFTAAGNMTQVSKARAGMWNAALGALLLVSSVVILQTINPNFVQQTTNLPGFGGITAPLDSTGPVQACATPTTQGFGAIGSLCSTNNDCSGETTCTDRVCTRPDGNVAGDSCATQVNCAAGFSCDLTKPDANNLGVCKKI